MEIYAVLGTDTHTYNIDLQGAASNVLAEVRFTNTMNGLSDIHYVTTSATGNAKLAPRSIFGQHVQIVIRYVDSDDVALHTFTYAKESTPESLHLIQSEFRPKSQIPILESAVSQLGEEENV